MTRLRLSISGDHPALAGHFPGHPVVPGALLVDLALVALGEARTTPCAEDATARAAGGSERDDHDARGSDPALRPLRQARFLAPLVVAAGAQADVELETSTTATGDLHVELSSSGVRIASFRLGPPGAPR